MVEYPGLDMSPQLRVTGDNRVVLSKDPEEQERLIALAIRCVRRHFETAEPNEELTDEDTILIMLALKDDVYDFPPLSAGGMEATKRAQIPPCNRCGSQASSREELPDDPGVWRCINRHNCAGRVRTQRRTKEELEGVEFTTHSRRRKNG
jgi:hypothetical protein